QIRHQHPSLVGVSPVESIFPGRANDEFFRTGALMRRGLFLGLMLFAASGEATAQCKVNGDSNEGKLLAFSTAPIVFSMACAPELLPPGSLRLGGPGEY